MWFFNWIWELVVGERGNPGVEFVEQLTQKETVSDFDALDRIAHRTEDLQPLEHYERLLEAVAEEPQERRDIIALWR